MAEPQSPEGAEESSSTATTTTSTSCAKAGDIARLASLQVDTAGEEKNKLSVAT